jgi:integrase
MTTRTSQKCCPGPAPSSAPTDRVAEQMGKAASMVIHGKGTGEIARFLGVDPGTIRYWRHRWNERWQAIIARAEESLLKSVRAMAGTDAILDDPNAHLRMARLADRMAEKKGVELFPADGELTLSKFYETWYLPRRLFDAADKTKEAYASAVRRWRLLTGDPPVKAITSDTIALFRDALFKLSGLAKGSKMATNSVRTHLRHIQALLDKLGQPDKGNRDALGILQRVPWAKPPREEQKIPKVVTPTYLSACYVAASTMKLPVVQGVEPSAWWRALLVVTWNTGLRAGTLFSMLWAEVDWPNRRLVLPSRRMKARRPMIVYLNDAALAALRSIHTDRALVFPWSSGVTSRRVFYRQLHNLETAAGVPLVDHFGLHGIRRSVATALYAVSPGAAQYALGHTTATVTRKSYVDGGPMVARALDALPQPEAFIGADVLPEPVIGGR